MRLSRVFNDENGVEVLRVLLKLLKISFTRGGTRALKSMPHYPSILTFSDKLSEYRVSSRTIRITENQLEEICLPAVAHIYQSNGHFVVLTKIDNDNLTYIDPGIGELTEAVQEFGLKWSGVILEIVNSESASEPHFATRRKVEILSRVRNASLYFLLALIIFLISWQWPAFIFPILFLVFGLAFSATLFMQTIGQETTLGQAVCKSGTSTDCNKVINSKLAKVYGDISLAEIALVFFASMLSIQIVSLSNGLGYNFLLGWLSFPAVPVTLFSIYYQWRVLKTWCLLCLGVVTCLWGWAAFYGFHLQDWSGGWPAVQAFGTGVAVLLLLWFLVRTSIINAARVPGLEKGLNKFRKSLSVFEALTAQKPEIHPEVHSGDVVLGTREANNSITIVTNPTCGPCIRAHQFIESCLEEHGVKLKVIFRFAVNPADTGVSGAVAKHLISLGLNDSEQLNAAMHAWYASEKPKLQEWLDRFSTEVHPEAQVRLAEHSNWCRANQINSTPTIFFNGRQIPEEFSLQDFEYFLRLKMAEVELETVGS